MQTTRRISPAANALSAGSADMVSKFEFCAKRPVDEINKAIIQEPQNSRLYSDRAECRSVSAANLSVEEFERSVGRIKAEAKADIDRALELDPKNGKAYFLRAKNAADSIDLTAGLPRTLAIQIVNDLDKAIELQPEDAAAVYYRAIFRFYDLEDRSGGMKDLETAVRLAPKNSNFLIKRAELHSEMKNWGGAIADYTSVLGVEPDLDYARLERAKAYRHTGENRKALADLNLVLKTSPYLERDVLDERSKVYRALGNVKAAAVDERRVKKLGGNPIQ